MNGRRELYMIAMVTALLLMTSCLTGEGAPTPPEPPRVFLQTSLASTPVTGKTIRVVADGNFQAALDGADPGDEIVLEASATYTGNFILPAKFQQV